MFRRLTAILPDVAEGGGRRRGVIREPPDRRKQAARRPHRRELLRIDERPCLQGAVIAGSVARAL